MPGFFGPFLAALAALYLPCWLIDSLINYIEFIPNHTDLGRLCFAKHNAAHHDERTMSHTMFRHHYFNKISKFWQNFTIFSQNFTILTKVLKIDKISQFLAALASLLWTYLEPCRPYVPDLPAHLTYLHDLRTLPTFLTYLPDLLSSFKRHFLQFRH